MTRTQMNKIANQIVALEQSISNPNLSKDEKHQAESQINQIALMLSRLPNGLQIMGKIDLIVQSKLESINFQKEG